MNTEEKNKESSEDMEMWDKCLSQSMMKFGIGVGTGLIMAGLFSSDWPFMVSVTFSLWLAVNDCQEKLNNTKPKEPLEKAA